MFVADRANLKVWQELAEKQLREATQKEIEQQEVEAEQTSINVA